MRRAAAPFSRAPRELPLSAPRSASPVATVPPSVRLGSPLPHCPEGPALASPVGRPSIPRRISLTDDRLTNSPSTLPWMTAATASMRRSDSDGETSSVGWPTTIQTSDMWVASTASSAIASSRTAVIEAAFVSALLKSGTTGSRVPWEVVKATNGANSPSLSRAAWACSTSCSRRKTKVGEGQVAHLPLVARLVGFVSCALRPGTELSHLCGGFKLTGVSACRTPR